jgi:hypothetical protein
LFVALSKIVTAKFGGRGVAVGFMTSSDTLRMAPGIGYAQEWKDSEKIVVLRRRFFDPNESKNLSVVKNLGEMGAVAKVKGARAMTSATSHAKKTALADLDSDDDDDDDDEDDDDDDSESDHNFAHAPVKSPSRLKTKHDELHSGKSKFGGAKVLFGGVDDHQVVRLPRAIVTCEPRFSY